MTIPASEIVDINPSVIGGGGSPLSLNGVIVSTNDLIPQSSVLSFGSSDAVGDYFGTDSDEYDLGVNYFLGYDNSTLKPGTIYFAPYADGARATWARSARQPALTVLQLNGMSGVITVVFEGFTVTSDPINLTTAESFSDAATLITAGLTFDAVCTWDAVTAQFLIAADIGGPGDITSMTGTLAVLLKMSDTTGVILSNGSAGDTPTTAMDNVVANTQNWVDFMTLWEPELADKELFAEWTTAQNQRYAYIAWDTDANAIDAGSEASFGAIANSLAYDGVVPVYNTPALAALIMGTVASIDFARTNARITVAFKSQAGFVPTVTDAEIATALLGNGYSFYGSYATDNDQFNFIYDGHMSGIWLWLDTFVNQVYLNSQLQLALMSLLTTVPSIPYTQSGYSLIRSAMADPINAGLNFGSIRPGVVLSEQQKAIVNNAAGKDVAGIIEQQGWYLQVLDPGAQVRAARGTPVINFWYTDGGAVQKLSVASTDII